MCVVGRLTNAEKNVEGHYRKGQRTRRPKESSVDQQAEQRTVDPTNERSSCGGDVVETGTMCHTLDLCCSVSQGGVWWCRQSHTEMAEVGCSQ